MALPNTSAQHFLGLAHQVASVARCGPINDEWASYVVIAPGTFEGEEIEPLTCASVPARRTPRRELVWIDFNLAHDPALADELRRLLRLEVEPFVIGAGQVAVEDTAEGVVVLALGDERQDTRRHGAGSDAGGHGSIVAGLGEGNPAGGKGLLAAYVAERSRG